MQWQCDSEIFIRVYKYSTFYLYLHECCGQLVNCIESELVYWQLVQASYWERNSVADTTWTIERVIDICCHTEAKRKWKKSFFLLAFCFFVWLVWYLKFKFLNHYLLHYIVVECCGLCVCVGHNHEPCKNSWSSWNVVWWQTHVSCRNYIRSFRWKICECTLAPPGKYYSSIYAAAAMRPVPISVHTVLEAALLPSCWHFRSHHMHHTDIVYCWM